MNLDLQDNFGAIRFEDSPFGFVRKVQQRYSFTPKQKEVLMKHFNMHGMTGQSQAYHEKIMNCAREAEVDFDIVRNWIGNVRRKKRIESSRFPSGNGVYIMDNEPKIPRMEGAHFGYPTSPQPPVPTTLVRQPTGIMHPISSSMGPQATQFSIPPTITQTQAVMNNQQPQIATSVQRNIVSTNSSASSSASANKPTPLQITKVESIPGQQSSCAINAAAVAVAAATPQTPAAVASTSAGTSSNERTIFLSKERQWKEHEIRRMMGNIQQSMQYLERLGCESIVVSHFEGKTFVSGTEKGVNYFADMQEVKPISEHMKRSGIDANVFSPVGTDSNSSIPEDATQEQKNDNNNTTTTGEEDQSGKARERSSQQRNDDKKKTDEQDDDEMLEGEEDDDGDEGDVTENKKVSNQIEAGQEVYIVDKNHFVIGLGNILPTPHQRIELKNAPPPEDYFD